MTPNRLKNAFHHGLLAQIRRWCDGVAISPDELQKRKRVKELIGT
jgi:hypothetical protein